MLDAIDHARNRHGVGRTAVEPHDPGQRAHGQDVI
jgi:hypothetical protein